jgi:hypothetical protein
MKIKKVIKKQIKNGKNPLVVAKTYAVLTNILRRNYDRRWNYILYSLWIIILYYIYFR